jgi:glycosyltransferase involved in cell wall biosynthesis/DNA-binding CsgD family transcriptional regulator
MPSIRIVDVKVPVRALVWSWNRMEWPPVEWFAGPCDVVHSQSPLLIPVNNAAQVVTVHDLDFLRHPDRMSAEIRRDYPSLARAHAARAHAVMVSSRYAAGEVIRELQLDATRVHVCPPGRPAWADDVRRRRERAAGQGGVRPILFMGTLSLRKNVGTLLEAYARLRAKVKDVPPLVLAGHRTPASARWEARCEQPPLKGHVTITGYVDADQKIDLYANAAMLVLPSYEEGFGLPVLEAMACGVPVAASNTAPVREVLRNGENGRLVDFFEVQAVAQAALEMLDKRRAQVPLRKQARADAQAYGLSEGVAGYDRAIGCAAHQASTTPPPLEGQGQTALSAVEGGGGCTSEANPPSPMPAVGFNMRDRELLQLLSAGLNTEQIAVLRHRSPATVRNQLSSLYQKLGVARRTEAVAKASVMNLHELKS